MSQTRLALPLLGLLVPTLATGHGREGANSSLDYLLRLTASSRPENADPDFDCGWRRLAADYYMTLLGSSFLTPAYTKPLHDALPHSV